MGKIEYAKGIRGDQDEKRIRGFFNTMIETVVQILVRDEEDKLVGVFAGTYINDQGDILTSNKMLPSKFKSLTFVNPGKDSFVLYKAAASTSKIFYRSKAKNLAIIKSQHTTIDHGCVTFADANEIQSGIIVRMLSHRSSTISFSATAGKISDLGDYHGFYARLPHKLIDDDNKQEHPQLKGCDPELHLIELTGLSGHAHSIGAPVFNNFGKMIGIYICLHEVCHYEYAINVDVIAEFLKEYESATPSNSSVVGKGKRRDGVSYSNKHAAHGKQKN